MIRSGVSEGPHLVLLPGHMCDERLFAPQISDLTRACATIQAPPLLGGDSVSALASEVLKAAPRRFALAGLSMGGIIAFEMLRQQPERITHLALIDTNARPETPDRQVTRQRDMAAVQAGRLIEVTLAGKSAYLGPDHAESAELRGLLAKMSEALGEEAFQVQAEALLTRPDSRPGLRHLDARRPTLILAGREDRLCPPEVQFEMADLIPHADLVLLGRCGHLSTLERAKDVSAELARLLNRSSEILH